jgi:hypothetical protein
MYTPQFSDQASVTIRRLAWALDLPMTKTIDVLISEISLIFSEADICSKCRDKTKCKMCGFNKQTQETAERQPAAAAPTAPPSKAA